MWIVRVKNYMFTKSFELVKKCKIKRKCLFLILILFLLLLFFLNKSKITQQIINIIQTQLHSRKFKIQIPISKYSHNLFVYTEQFNQKFQGISFFLFPPQPLAARRIFPTEIQFVPTLVSPTIKDNNRLRNIFISDRSILLTRIILADRKIPPSWNLIQPWISTWITTEM